MPKISSNNLYINVGDIKTKYNIEIKYDQLNGFYALVPASIRRQCELLSKEEAKAFDLEHVSKSKHDHSQNNPGVRCATESETLSKMKALLMAILAKEVASRNVIIIHFDGGSIDRRGKNGDGEMPEIVVSLGITYAVEEKMGDGQPVYKVYKEPDVYEKIRVSESSWRNDTDKDIVIDDTPDNRSFVETLYEALEALRLKMIGFAASKEAVVKFISSQQKLLQ